MLTLNNLLPGIWNPGTGTLDAFGRAKLQLNANILGKALTGVPVWIGLVVLDSSSPTGIAAIAETLVIHQE